MQTWVWIREWAFWSLSAQDQSRRLSSRGPAARPPHSGAKENEVDSITPRQLQLHVHHVKLESLEERCGRRRKRTKANLQTYHKLRAPLLSFDAGAEMYRPQRSLVRGTPPEHFNST